MINKLVKGLNQTFSFGKFEILEIVAIIYTNVKMSRMKYFCEGLTPEMINIAEKELGETEATKERCLRELKDLINDEPDFNPCIEDGFLLRFLRVRKFKVDEAFRSLLKYYKYKARYSGITTNFKPSEIKSVLEQDNFTIMKYRDQNNLAVGIARYEKYDFDKFTADEGVSSIFLCSDIMMQVEATQVLGYSIIVDLKGFTFKMAKKSSDPRMLYRLITGITDYVPCRIKAYHIVNQPHYCDAIIAIILKFLSKKQKQRIHFHGSDFKSLHQHIPPDILPEELGGTQGPNSKCAEEFRSIIMDHEDYIIKMNTYGFYGDTLDSLKKRSFNVFGL